MAEARARAEAHDVAVIGCGLMGAAIARTLAGSGHSVAAWNRTFERAQELEGAGVTPIRSIADAVGSSGLVLACTRDYETTVSALAPIEDWRGATLVNLASGTPAEAREMEKWASDRGIEYLDGDLVCYPRQLGEPATIVVYSGSASAWHEHERTLLALGAASFHASERVETANALYLATAGFYIAALGAYVEAITYMRDEGVSSSLARPPALLLMDMLRDATGEAGEAIESGDHKTDQATLEIFAAGMRSTLAAMRGAGQRARILGATLESLEAADAQGLGELGFSAQTKVIGRPVTNPRRQKLR